MAVQRKTTKTAEQDQEQNFTAEIKALNETIEELRTDLLKTEDLRQKEVKKCIDLEKGFEMKRLAVENLTALLSEKEAEVDKLNEAISQAPKPTDYDLAFNLPNPAKPLLMEYANRLGVEPHRILIDMFVRYVTEQYNKWFFDFKVKKSEFKEVCGYSHNEVLEWLNLEKEA